MIDKADRVIETPRLILRMWEEEDASGLFAYAKNPEVGPPAGWKPHADMADSLRIIRELFIPNNSWAIVNKEDGRIIGSIGLENDKQRPGVSSREIGYSLAREYWGRGLMTEAARAVIDFGFRELDLDVISICTGEANHRSQGVIDHCGFVYEGTRRRCYRIYDGSVRDSRCYSLLREEWEML